MKICARCKNKSLYLVIWGPNPDQKDYICKKHLQSYLDALPSKNFFIERID
jgi:hypothetical protein